MGDEADAAGPAKVLLPIVEQSPDAVPAKPPPSKTEVEPDIPAVDAPMPDPVPAVDVPMPDAVPALEFSIPSDDCGIEAPMPEHGVVLPVVSPSGDAPGAAGLKPGDASSVAPRGTPVGATGEPAPMPSGDVMPSGEVPGEMLVPPTCAKAEPQSKRTAAAVAITKRVIVGPIFPLALVNSCEASAIRGRSQAGRPLLGGAIGRILAEAPITRCCRHQNGVATNMTEVHCCHVDMSASNAELQISRRPLMRGP